MPSNHLILCCPLLFLTSIFPALGSFPMSQFFASGGQSTGISASASVLSMNIQNWFPLRLTGWISQESSPTPQCWWSSKAVQKFNSNSSKASILKHLAFFMVQLSHPYMTTGKTIALNRWTFVSKVMSLLFNMLSRFVIPFLRRSKYLLISWLQSPPAVILEPQKIKSDTVSTVSHHILNF